jgi:hypothetical protein
MTATKTAAAPARGVKSLVPARIDLEEVATPLTAVDRPEQPTGRMANPTGAPRPPVA